MVDPLHHCQPYRRLEDHQKGQQNIQRVSKYSVFRIFLQRQKLLQLRQLQEAAEDEESVGEAIQPMSFKLRGNRRQRVAAEVHNNGDLVQATQNDLVLGEVSSVLPVIDNNLLGVRRTEGLECASISELPDL